jgi:hypothetical protein
MSRIRILVTGSRELDAAGAARVRGVLAMTLDELDMKNLGRRDIVIVHGGARGVDTEAENWALRCLPLGSGVTAERYPADWDRHGKRAGFIRNEHMVSLGAHVCLAFPRKVSPGTWNCIHQAAGAGILVRIYPLPDLAGTRP